MEAQKYFYLEAQKVRGRTGRWHTSSQEQEKAPKRVDIEHSCFLPIWHVAYIHACIGL